MMNYSLGKGDLENWVVSDTAFSPDTLGKTESIMYLGNGYMGLRSTTEEPYLNETRNLLVSGTFNKFSEEEVTELPNVADITRLDIRVDGEHFSLELGKVEQYKKQLNLQTAELIRTFDWTSPSGKKLRFHFRRFVSLDDMHLIGMKINVESLTDDVQISFDSGINAQLTNTGSQHFHEGEKRIFNKRYIQLVQSTIESNIDVVLNTMHQIKINGIDVKEEPVMNMERRKVWVTHDFTLRPNDHLEVEKLSTVYTSRDKEFDKPDYTLDNLRKHSLNELKRSFEKGYEALFQSHKGAWKKKVWDVYDFEVNSEDPFDQLSLRFALYHLTAMTPAHDERMGIAAKALSGEGYKGHSFWDTELFILPFFTYSNPKVAKSLLKYRYHGLAGARKKATASGYEGAMYPWEAAWPTDGEVTPVWGAVDIITGEQTKIWSGFIEQHISSDIAFAVYQYYKVTGDQDFMDKYGYEMVFDTARFWISRLEWDEEKQEYHINDVIGPDEYKEHVNNNAFTNYMAHFNIKLAIFYYDKLKTENPKLLEELRDLLDLEKAYKKWKSKLTQIYLPKPREEDSVIPQDDSYLQLKKLDLTKYKQADKVGTLFSEYNLEQVNQMQITKQADVMILLYLLEQTENVFSKEIKKANFDYYEPKTTHDSSLSLSTHAIMANDLGKSELAYSLFRKASEIDLGPTMNSSDEGIHAASIGGIWQAAVFGFAGIRLIEGKLKINPSLPKHWKNMKFTINWKGQPISITITNAKLTIIPLHDKKIIFEVFGEDYETNKQMEIKLGSSQTITF
ncbi:putative glycosyl hydrolase [Virgibacillus natechei]|uniref:Glycosyl hydrolase n=1 Tax=Virgibacillus natechei TaxID=1216297 RepID=A0ABS4IK65_9BACI|nr:glycoside hydrolase family 65 protein [Virgibacillus natechei]MBP1971350.1 putative glycosyl hydrolase [Virgibacillus natechei]UZD12915.1 glycoside hydrolase family 65 protein [Virgibacillus natechei]